MGLVWKQTLSSILMKELTILRTLLLQVRVEDLHHHFVANLDLYKNNWQIWFGYCLNIIVTVHCRL